MSKRLSPKEWAEIKTAFERNEKSVRELAEEYGVSKQAIYQGLSERGAKRMSDLAETTGDDDAEAAAKEREANVRRAKKKQEEYARYNDVIVQLTMKRVIEGSQQNGSLSSKHKDIVVLNNAAKIVERARKENWEILRVEDLLGEEEELPDLNVGEYSQDELDEIRQAQEEHYVEANDLDVHDEPELPEDED